MRGVRRFWLVAFGVAGVAFLAGVSWFRVAPAEALPGPATLSTGFVDDTLFYGPGQGTEWFPRMRQLDSTWVRIPADWGAIAPANPPPGFRAADPADPSYGWTSLDSAVRAAGAASQRVLLTLESPPAWALGGHAPHSAAPNSWRPSATAYGAFAHAVAARYSGHFPDPQHPGTALPRVGYFQAWNEPNLSFFLGPQWTRTGRGYVPASPAIYRRLLNALYTNVKAAQPTAYVLAGGLAPYGDPPGGGRMRPVAFLRELLCLRGTALRPEPCPDPAHFDGIDIHPYALTPTIHAFNADDVSVPDLGRLARVLRASGRSGSALPRRPKPIWITELDWNSSPPARSGVPLGTQARYLALAFYEAWRQSVSHLLWYEVRDLGVPAGTFTGGGLFFSSGGAKPSAAAFRFPFVAVRGGGMTTLWGRAPAGRAVTIEVAGPGGWRRLMGLTTTRGGVFYARRRLAPHLTLRARVGMIASVPSPTG